MKITPKNWRDFQHYKNRNPPWIRLHKALLDNFDFHRLPVASKALAPMLWLLASDSVDGLIDADPEILAFRLRMTGQDVTDALEPLIRKGFFLVQQDASEPLAERKQVAVPETETETEQRQKRASAPRVPALLIPDWVPPKEWEDFETHRKAMRGVPFTEAARLGVLRELEKLKAKGHDPAELLSTAVVRGWRTVFEPKTAAGLVDVARMTVPGPKPSTLLVEHAAHMAKVEAERQERIANKSASKGAH